MSEKATEIVNPEAVLLKCSICEKHLPVDAFYKNKMFKHRMKRTYACKECARNRNNNYQAKKRLKKKVKRFKKSKQQEWISKKEKYGEKGHSRPYETKNNYTEHQLFFKRISREEAEEKRLKEKKRKKKTGE